MKHFIILTIVLSIVTSCNYDQVTTEYLTYQKALEDDFFAKGWIPYELQSPGMTNIYVRANLDVNTYIFSFETEQLPNNLIPSLNPVAEPLVIHGIEIPTWWNDGIANQPKTAIPDGHRTPINLVLDKKNGRIYGWSENSR
jgi:hypothetical protein